MATAETAFGGGLNSSSGGELKLYLCCTGSTVGQTPRSAYGGVGQTPQVCLQGGRPPPPRYMGYCGIRSTSRWYASY